MQEETFDGMSVGRTCGNSAEGAPYQRPSKSKAFVGPDHLEIGPPSIADPQLLEEVPPDPILTSVPIQVNVLSCLVRVSTLFYGYGCFIW